MRELVEQQAFSQRVVQALEKRGYRPSPTKLQRAFNAAWDGPEVTIHTCRKWLVGQSMPTQDKLRVLAHILGVDIVWLRFGGLSETVAETYTLAERDMLARFRAMTDRQQTALVKFMRTLEVQE